MERTIHAEDIERQSANFNADYPDQCPICRRYGVPEYLYGRFFEVKPDDNGDKRYLLQAVFQCPSLSCRTLYVGKYLAWYFGREFTASLRSVDSNIYIKPSKEDVRIKKISPRFYTTYQQAQQADDNNLKEVAGPGYRKALEILIKDYLIGYTYKNNSDMAEKIKNKLLGKCIKDDINASDLKQIAERSAWIGNDETHYCRIHEDEDLETLKTLLEITLHHISKDLQSAELIERIQKKS